MQRYSQSVMKKKFVDTNLKSAYMKCCKWLATNVIANKRIANMCEYSITKQTDNAESAIVLDIRVVLEKSEVEERHCAVCREAHNSFLLNEEVKCNKCKLQAYHRREEEMLRTKLQYVKECLE